MNHLHGLNHFLHGPHGEVALVVALIVLAVLWLRKPAGR